MTKSTVYIRTEQGNELLRVQYGNISGDARRLLELIDGETSAGAISDKVPPSVQSQLEEIFAHLLSERLIEEIFVGGSGAAESSGIAGQGSYQKTIPVRPKSNEDGIAPNEIGVESQRRNELENELAEVRSQLAATKARQREVEEVCRKLEQQVANFEQIRHQESTEKMQQPSEGSKAGNGLQDSLDNLNQLNQALKDQQKILDGTLKLRSYQMQLSEQQLGVEQNVSLEEVPQTNPNYKKLRGLEFFKGFANAELLRFLNIAKWKSVHAGDTILNEGDIGMPFFIIVSGTVKVVKKEKVLATLGWGEFFGEFAHLSEYEPLRSAQVVAATDCELLVVDPMDVEFSSVQMRLNVVEALLRGQVKRVLLSSRSIDNLMKHMDIPSGNEPR